MSVHPSSVIADGAIIGAGVEIGPFCHIGPRVTLDDGVRLRSHISLTGITRIGAGCDLYPGVALGGGLTGVNRDVIPYAMAFGDHVELAGLNLVGLKRRGLSRDTINAMRATFRSVFYGEGAKLADRARAARDKYPAVAEVGEM